MTDPVADAERLRPKELRFAPIVVFIAMMMHGCPLTPQHQDNLSKPSCYDCARFLPKPFITLRRIPATVGHPEDVPTSGGFNSS